MHWARLTTVTFSLVIVGCTPSRPESDGGVGGGTGIGGGGGTGGGETTPCSTCAGCCLANMCIQTVFETNASCGANGAACAACASNQKCTSGVCTVVPDAGTQTHPTETIYEATLRGNRVTPMPVASSATGDATAVLSADKSSVTYALTHDVPGVTAAHIHQGYAFEDGPIVFVFPDGGSPISGVLMPIPGLFELEGGHWYVDIHSSAHPDGEIRGQLIIKGAALYVCAMSGAQVVPPVITPATGAIQTVVYFNGSDAQLGHENTVEIHGAYSSLTPTVADVHRGAVGMVSAGQPLFRLSGSNGTLTGIVGLSSLTTAGLGNFFADIHTAAHVDGEIRCQLVGP